MDIWKVFSEAGIQWMGWGLSAFLVLVIVRMAHLLMPLVRDSTAAQVANKVVLDMVLNLLMQRPPPNGGK